MGQLGGGDPDLFSPGALVVDSELPDASAVLSTPDTATVGGVGDLMLSGVTELTSMQSGVVSEGPESDIFGFLSGTQMVLQNLLFTFIPTYNQTMV